MARVTSLVDAYLYIHRSMAKGNLTVRLLLTKQWTVELLFMNTRASYLYKFSIVKGKIQCLL